MEASSGGGGSTTARRPATSSPSPPRTCLDPGRHRPQHLIHRQQQALLWGAVQAAAGPPLPLPPQQRRRQLAVAVGARQVQLMPAQQAGGLAGVGWQRGRPVGVRWWVAWGGVGGEGGGVGCAGASSAGGRVCQGRLAAGQPATLEISPQRSQQRHLALDIHALQPAHQLAQVLALVPAPGAPLRLLAPHPEGARLPAQAPVAPAVTIETSGEKEG